DHFHVPLVLQPEPMSKLTQLQQYLLLLLKDFLCLAFLSIWFLLLLIFLSSSVLYRGKKQLFQILDLALRNPFLFSPVLTQIPVPLTLVASYKNVNELSILPHQLNQWLYPVRSEERRVGKELECL